MAYMPNPALEAEIARLNDLGRQRLREIWIQHLGTVPEYASTYLLRRCLAHELQIRVYGGLKAQTRRRLRRLYEGFKANPKYRPLPSYALKPGTTFSREWRGATHRVGVMDSGFEYLGKRYKSLSEIARLITGTKWSGPTFFGLRRPCQ